MKTTLILSMAISLATAGDDRYVDQMVKSIAAVYKAETIEALQQVVNVFDRIGNAEKTKWEPFYYSAFGYIMMANLERELSKKDLYLDMAKNALEKAQAIDPRESEIIALDGFIHMIRVTVDPGTRGPEYSMKAMQAFSTAAALNPNNPRALALIAQLQLGTARFFGQPPTDACETASKALSLFLQNENAETGVAPAWGKRMTEELTGNCK